MVSIYATFTNHIIQLFNHCIICFWNTVFIVKRVVFPFSISFYYRNDYISNFIYRSIVSVHCNFIIHWIIKKWSPLKDWGNHKYESVRTDLALYVTSKNNIHYIISFAYVVFLIYRFERIWAKKCFHKKFPEVAYTRYTGYLSFYVSKRYGLQKCCHLGISPATEKS